MFVIILLFVVAYFLYTYISSKLYPIGPSFIELAYKFLVQRTWTIRELSKKYGAIYTVWFGFMPMVVISSRKMAHEVFADPSNYEDTLWYPYISDIAFGKNVKSILWNNTNESWRQLRKLVTTSIAKSVKDNTFSQRTIDSVDQAFDHIQSNHGNEPFDFSQYSFYISANLVPGWIFNHKLHIDSEEFNDFKHLADKATAHIGILSTSCFSMPLRHLLKVTGIQGTVSHSMSMIYKKTMRQFLEAQEKFDDNHNERITSLADIMVQTKSTWLNAKGEDAWRHLTDENIAASITEIIAGTTQFAEFFMRWLMIHLIKYPEIQLRLRDEISTIDDEIQFMDDKARFPLTQAFVAEVLRLRPHAPLFTGHALSKDITVMGHDLKKGTVIGLDAVTMNTDGQEYTDPLAFNPDRFLDQDGHFDSLKSNYITQFGIGARTCPGKDFIRQQYCVVLVRMLRKSKGSLFTESPGQEPVDLEPDPNFVVFMKPKPYRMSIKSII
ncbi:Cytochrome P450 2K1 [Halotydeus destructor]|nr:Cytochrome P450 2K1 [Halotydeus destructor]